MLRTWMDAPDVRSWSCTWLFCAFDRNHIEHLDREDSYSIQSIPPWHVTIKPGCQYIWVNV